MLSHKLKRGKKCGFALQFSFQFYDLFLTRLLMHTCSFPFIQITARFLHSSTAHTSSFHQKLRCFSSCSMHVVHRHVLNPPRTGRVEELVRTWYGAMKFHPAAKEHLVPTAFQERGCTGSSLAAGIGSDDPTPLNFVLLGYVRECIQGDGAALSSSFLKPTF